LTIDNAGFHSLSKYKLSENIRLIKIPPYSPEINPCEKIWHLKRVDLKIPFSKP
jgi:transposase